MSLGKVVVMGASGQGGEQAVELCQVLGKDGCGDGMVGGGRQ